MSEYLQVTWTFAAHPDKKDCLQALSMLLDTRELVGIEYRLRMAATKYREPVERISDLRKAQDLLDRTISKVLAAEKESPEHVPATAWLGDKKLTT